MNKGYTYRGVLIVVLLIGALFTGGSIFNNSFNDNQESLWGYNSPVETRVSSSGNEGEVIIDQFQENENSGWVKTQSGKVYWENSIGYIEIDPHTCKSFHCKHNFKITNKVVGDQTINVAFIFNEKPKNPKLYKLETVTKELPITYIQNNSYMHPNGTYVEQYDTIQNGTEEVEVGKYVDRSSAFSVSNIDGKWVYYTTDYIIDGTTTDKGYFEYDRTPRITDNGWGVDGKWDMYLWKGNYNNPTWELKLDPWENTTFTRRIPYNINHTGGLHNLTDYEQLINVTYDTDMQVDFSDLRFTWLNTTSGEEEPINYVLGGDYEDSDYITVDGSYSDVWVDIPLIRALNNETVYLYYRNSSVVNSESNATLVFDLYDDFVDSTLNTDTWDTIGSPTVTITGGELNVTDTGGGSGSGISSVDFYEEGILEYEAHRITGIQGNTYVGWGNSTFGTPSGLFLFDGLASPDLNRTRWGQSGVNSQDISFSAMDITFNKHSIEWNTSTYLNFTTRDSGTVTRSSDIPSDIMDIQFQAARDGTNTPVIVEWVLIRSQADVVPVAQAGSEESLGLTVELNEPTDDSIVNTQGAIEFNATATLSGNLTDSYFINASVYNNRTGAFQLNQVNTSELINNTKFTISDASFTSGGYRWNIEVCANVTIEDLSPEVICQFAQNDFTFIIDEPGLELRVFDEKTLEQLNFNVTISNTTDSVEFTNQTLLDVGINNITIGESTISPSNFSGGYEQRNYFLTFSDLVKFNLTAYLIKSSDSVDVTFTVQTFQNQAIEDALIEVSHPTLGLVAQAFTDGTGKATFPLDPTVEYLIDISKDGFDPITNFAYKPSSPFAQTFILGEEIPVQTDTTFQGMSYRFDPSGSFVIITNGTGEIDLITSSQTLEWWSLNLTYNDTSVFFENQTSSSGGTIQGIFNITDSLGLTETFFPSNFTDKNLVATFQFKKTGESRFTVVKNYTMTESAGLYSLLKNSPFTDGVKGLVWMILTLFVGAFTGFVMRNPVVTGLVVISFMGLGVVLSWLPLLLFGMVILGAIGIMLAYRLRG